MTKTYLRTASGLNLYLSHPCAAIRIEDAAAQLAKIARFNGATREPYSVAQHSVVVSRLMRKHGHNATTQLAGLIHDVPEYVFGDMARPIQWHIFGESDRNLCIASPWDHAHNAMMDEVLQALGLPPYWPPGTLEIVKHFDDMALRTEWRDLMPGDEPDYMAAYPEPDPGRILPNENWRTSCETFLALYHGLRREMATEALR